MQKRNRDYKAEYAARKQRAQKARYSGYGQVRRIRKQQKIAKAERDELAEQIAVTLFDTGLYGIMNEEGLPLVSGTRRHEYWDLFRKMYDRLNPA